MTIYRSSVRFSYQARSYTASVRVTHNDGPYIRGEIDLTGLKKKAGFKFAWNRTVFGEPFVYRLYGGTDWRAAKRVGRAALEGLVHQVVSDNAGETPGVDPARMVQDSDLIVAGHVRRPCKVQTGDTITMRRATVVNPANLSPSELLRARRVVQLWNDLARLFRAEVGDPLQFDEWVQEHVDADQFGWIPDPSHPNAPLRAG